jgi:hypothetical protein
LASVNAALASTFDPLLVTFNCGANPVVINVTSTITPTTHTDIAVDAGTPGLITLNGGTSVRITRLTVVTDMTVKNLTFTGGRAAGCKGTCGIGSKTRPTWDKIQQHLNANCGASFLP